MLRGNDSACVSHVSVAFGCCVSRVAQRNPQLVSSSHFIAGRRCVGSGVSMGRDDARAVNCVSYSPSEAPLKVLKDSTEAPSVSVLHISLVRFSSSSVTLR